MSKPRIGVIPSVQAMLEELAWWTHALREARSEREQTKAA